MIVLMEDQHYERVLIPFDQNTPLIPVGSVSVKHILPYMKVSEKVWVSMSVDNVKQHNKEVIDTHELDRNKELNYWYDYQIASKKISQIKFSIIPPITETSNEHQKYSVPNCAIKYHGFYIAALCYLAAIKDEKSCHSFIEDFEAYLIKMSENSNDTETLLNTLEIQNQKIYTDLSLKSGEDPFTEQDLVSHYDKCFAIMKEKIFFDFVKKTKLRLWGGTKPVEYSPFGQRTKFTDKIDVKNIVDHLKKEAVIPKYLLPVNNKANIEENSKNLDQRKKNVVKTETIKNKESTKVSHQAEISGRNIELKNEPDNSSNKKNDQDKNVDVILETAENKENKMVDNFDEKLEENIALKSEDDETSSQKEIFDNCKIGRASCRERV